MDLLLLFPSVCWRAQLGDQWDVLPQATVLSEVQDECGGTSSGFLGLSAAAGAATPLEGACVTDRPEARLLKTAAAPGLRFSGRLGGGTSRAPLLRVWAGLPGLLGHLIRPADASFWSELVATWAPISETQIAVSRQPSTLQKPQRAQGQPGLLPVFHAESCLPPRGHPRPLQTPADQGDISDSPHALPGWRL